MDKYSVREVINEKEKITPRANHRNFYHLESQPGSEVGAIII